MLILANRRDWPDHPYPEADRYRKGENDMVSAHCRYTWWWECDHVDPGARGKSKTTARCGRLHRVSCDGGRHIPLELAEVALRQAGWRQVDDGSWRCPLHRPPSSAED